jgi:hypothetical protein
MAWTSMYSTSQNPRPTELSDLGQQQDSEVANSSDADHGITTSPTTTQSFLEESCPESSFTIFILDHQLKNSCNNLHFERCVFEDAHLHI